MKNQVKQPSLFLTLKYTFELLFQSIFLCMPWLLLNAAWLYIQKTYGMDMLLGWQSGDYFILKSMAFIFALGIINLFLSFLILSCVYSKWYFNEINYIKHLKIAFSRFFPILTGIVIALGVGSAFGFLFAAADDYYRSLFGLIGFVVVVLLILYELISFALFPVVLINEKVSLWEACKKSRTLLLRHRHVIVILYMTIALGGYGLSFIANTIFAAVVTKLLICAMSIALFDYLTECQKHKRRIFIGKQSHATNSSLF